MATKPTKKPLWATTGDKTEPALSKKKTGWEYLEKPPYEWFNWLLNLIYQWIDWLEETISPLPGLIGGNTADIQSNDIEIVNLELNNESIVENGYLTYDPTDTGQVLTALKSHLVVPRNPEERICRVQDGFKLDGNYTSVAFINIECLDQSLQYNIYQYNNSSPFTKILLNEAADGFEPFSPGSGNGGAGDGIGLPSQGKVIFYFALLNPTDGSIDYGFDDDPTGVNLMGTSAVSSAGFTKWRCIGWCRIIEDTFRAIEPFLQMDNRIYFGKSPEFNRTITKNFFTPIDLFSPAWKLPNVKGIIGADVYLYGVTTSTDTIYYSPVYRTGWGDDDYLGVPIYSPDVVNCKCVMGHAEMETGGSDYIYVLLRGKTADEDHQVTIIPKYWQWSSGIL